jgi:hypothetical protein
MIELGCAFVLGAAAGGALVWLFKTSLQTLLIDADTLAVKLRSEADAVAALARKA